VTDGEGLFPNCTVGKEGPGTTTLFKEDEDAVGMDGASAGVPSGTGVLSPFRKPLEFNEMSELFPTFTKDEKTNAKIQTRFIQCLCVVLRRAENDDSLFLFDG